MDTAAELDRLHRVPPEEFVAARDEAVARARAAGDRDAARALAAARRPTRAAWLANLLVHDARDEVEGLLALAPVLAEAQRSLDGPALRQVSAQRNRLVGALARRAAGLGRAAGGRVDSGLEREVRTVLESALADPELAGRVRSGRLERFERHSGFGPLGGDAGSGRAPDPGRRDPGDASVAAGTGRGSTDGDGSAGADTDTDAADEAGELAGRRRESRRRAEAERAAERAQARRRAEQERERERLRRAVAEAEDVVQGARLAAHDAARERDDAHDRAEDAAARRDDAHRAVEELAAELERARAAAGAADTARAGAGKALRAAERHAERAEAALARAEQALADLRTD
ncbi:hypothetical protein [Pseudonocardia spirodelae]|uniref:Transposase n=1 Tax=Pseudonocardia spirodelae TaxID=3133431 RepID=A0ABU8T810_9PSEU